MNCMVFSRAHNRPVIFIALVGVMLAAALVMSPPRMQSADAATSNVVVSAQVPGATYLSVSACSGGVANVTDFETMVPGDSDRATGGCVVTFGSPNETSMLKMGQTDGGGNAMFKMTDGALETGFGGDGTVTTDFGSNLSDVPHGVVVQPDGKVVAAGTCDIGAGDGEDLCVARYLTDGTLDPSFSGDGRVNIPVSPSSTTERDVGFASDIQSNGRIVVAGYCDMGVPTEEDLCVIRLTTAGILDTSFGEDGKVTLDVSNNEAEMTTSVIAGGDGRIYLGSTCEPAPGVSGWCATRLQPNGDPDLSYGSGGTGSMTLTADLDPDFSYSATLQPDNKLVLVGYCQITPAQLDGCVARFKANGTPDETFSGDGFQQIVAPGFDNYLIFGAAIQQDGRIVVSGVCNDAAGNFGACITRMMPDGTLDASFNTDGILVHTIGAAPTGIGTTGVLIQPDNKIIAAGTCSSLTSTDACIMRVTSSGQLDTTFGTSGVATINTAPGTNDELLWSIAPSLDGGIAVAGNCNMDGATNDDFCVTMLEGSGTIPQYVNTTTDWDTGAGFFGTCLLDVDAGAVNDWTTTGACNANDDDLNWYAIPPAMTKVAHAPTNTPAATATFNFGVKVGTAQPPGAYSAPITFEVLAPNE